MRYFLDCEFIEDGKTIDLISIGIVAEDGRTLYYGNKECDFRKASDWVVANVLKPLGFMSSYFPPDHESFWKSRQYIKEQLLFFFAGGDVNLDADQVVDAENYKTVQVWGEWCSYDWVALCQLFGTMMDLPAGFPMRCRDVVQYCEDDLGLSTDDWPESLETEGNHNALMGARTVKARYEWCEEAYRYVM
jgi:hypothetical protein